MAEHSNHDQLVAGSNPGCLTLVVANQLQLFFLLGLGSNPSKHKLLTPPPAPHPPSNFRRIEASE